MFHVRLLKHSFSSFAFPELVVLMEVFCVRKHLWLQNEAEVCLSIHPAISLGAALLNHLAAKLSSAVYLTFSKHHLSWTCLFTVFLAFTVAWFTSPLLKIVSQIFFPSLGLLSPPFPNLYTDSVL